VHTVLLIDRDRDTREILDLALCAAGYRVLQSAQAAPGLLLARTSEPAVVITEFVVDNLCVVEELRRDPMTSAMPCVVLTTSVFPESRSRVLAATGLFVAKPMTPRRVLELIATLAAARPAKALARTRSATPTRRWPRPA